MSSDPESRRGIAQRTLDRAAARGQALEDDTAFMTLLAKWIDGEIPMRIMRERYFEAVAQRRRPIVDP